MVRQTRSLADRSVHICVLQARNVCTYGCLWVCCCLHAVGVSSSDLHQLQNWMPLAHQPAAQRRPGIRAPNAATRRYHDKIPTCSCTAWGALLHWPVRDGCCWQYIHTCLTWGFTTRHAQLALLMTESVMLPIMAFFMALRPRDAAADNPTHSHQGAHGMLRTSLMHNPPDH